ncbi:MAG TPA: SIMPL domain-containing protein, partial [Candidatus Baltobacteraceae bacterium]|nr:SIMPL domain-containing protein [Candidatus Baltobacteraceae bacterium]
ALPNFERESTITVTGTGSISRTPDQASINLQIVTSDDVATTSTSKNNDIYNALQSKLAALGVPSSSIKTQWFNVQFVPHPPKDLPVQQRQARYGYITTRALLVDVAPIENVGKAIDAANAAGVSDISNVTFGLKDRRGAYLSALSAAVDDARAQANALANASGMRIVRVRNITTGSEVRPMLQARALSMAAAPSPPTPTEIEPSGPIETTATVTISYQVQ